MPANYNIRTNDATKVPAMPSLPASVGPEMRKYLQTLEQILDIRLGRRGDPRDRAVTLRELIDSGLAQELAASPYNPNAGSTGFVQGGARLQDLAVPPAPTGFTADGAFSQVHLNWNYPSYSNHSHTEVHSHTSDVIGDAVLIGIQTGRVFIDPVGQGQTRYYWVRHVNTDNITGPFNSASGTVATTAADVSFLLTTLAGAITNSELASSLSTPIGQIPGINSSITTINGNITQLDNFVGFDSSYSGDSLLTRMGAVETTANGAATSAQLQSEQTTRANADSALASDITTLNTTVSGNSTSISTQASSINGLEAKYVVKIDNNGAVAGYGLASTANSAGNIVSEFIVNADRFAIMRGGSNTAAATVPFVVQASATTLNGESVPAGVYMADAFIKNGSIVSAKIGTLSADKLTAGTISADRIGTNTISASKLVLDNSTITSQNINGIPTVIIKDLGVGEAKIGNLQVSTLKIQDQAVTFPHAETTTANLAIASSSNSTTFSTIQTLTATFSGAPVLISGCFSVRSHNDQALMRYRIRRGTTVLFTSQSKAVRATPDLFVIPFSFLDESTSSGARTYTLQAYVQDEFGNYSDRTLSTLECKK